MKPLKFDRHAKRRMKEREVMEEEVELTINAPDFNEQSVRGRTNAFKFINDRFLRVTYREELDHILIITVTMRKKTFKER